jgi:hypothetical protein
MPMYRLHWVDPGGYKKGRPLVADHPDDNAAKQHASDIAAKS